MMHPWKNGRIKDLIESLESGVSVNGEDRIPADNEPAVLKVSAVTYGVFDPTASKPIIKNDLGRAKCNPKAGQIIISRSNTPDLVGASAYIDRSYPARYLPDKLWQTVPKKNVNVEMRWLAYFLASPWARFQLSRLATGTSSSMKNITKSELLTLPVPIPPLSDQTAIADLLSTWDAAIEKTEKLIAAKERRFLWLLSRLISDKRHPRGHIRDFATEVSTRNRDEAISQVLSVTNHSGFVLPEDQFERRVASSDLSNYKVVRRGQYAYNPSRINVGSIARLNDWEKGVLSPMYVVFAIDEDKIDSDFFLHWLFSHEAKQRIKKSAQGSVRETVSFGDFAAIPFPQPPLDKQREIAEILNTARKEIELLKTLADFYRQQKRGLMQILLTGRWRVTS